MAVIVERPDVAFKLLEMAKATRPTRAPGFHATDHTHCLRKTVWEQVTGRPLLQAESAHDPNGYRTELLFIRGEGIGNFYEEGKPEYRFWADDFGTCSVDRLWEEDGKHYVMELKTTKMSAAYPLTEDSSATNGYIAQVSMYLAKHLMSNEGIDPDETYKCFIYVFYDMGDYLGGDRRPDHRAFELGISGWELAEWNEELNRRHQLLVESFGKFSEKAEKDTYFAGQLDRMRDLLSTHGVDLEQILPPVGEHWKFECEQYSRCPLKDLIDCPGTKDNAKWGLPFQFSDEIYARESRVRKGRK